MDFKPVNYMFLLGIPARLPPSAHERLTQIFFETLHVSNLFIVERPLLQLYSCASVSGIVIDTASEYIDISLIIDSVIHYPSLLKCSIGEKDCDAYLVHLLLKENPELANELAPDAALTPLAGDELFSVVLDLVKLLKEKEYIRFSPAALGFTYTVGADKAVGATSGADGEDAEDDEDEGITDVAKAIASGKAARLLAGKGMDTEIVAGEGDTLIIPNPVSNARNSITIGPARHRYAEPLFDPTLLCALQPHDCAAAINGKRKCNLSPLQEVVAAAVTRFPESSKRGVAWEYVVFTGGLSLIRGEDILSPFCVSSTCFADPCFMSILRQQVLHLQLSLPFNRMQRCLSQFPLLNPLRGIQEERNTYAHQVTSPNTKKDPISQVS